jgi:porin
MRLFRMSSTLGLSLLLSSSAYLAVSASAWAQDIVPPPVHHHHHHARIIKRNGNFISASRHHNLPTRTQVGSHTVAPPTPAPPPALISGILVPRPGPLAPIGVAARSIGITPHIDYYDFLLNNFGMGIYPGNTNHTGIIAIGADTDLGKLLNIHGGFVHFEEDLIPYNSGRGIFGDIGDLTPAWEPFYAPTYGRLAVFNYEQKFLDGKLSVTVGRDNMLRTFDAGLCGNWVSCYNDVMYQDINAQVISIGTWMGRFRYNFNPSWYIQGGVYADDPRPIAAEQSGWDNWNAKTDTGVVAIGEAGFVQDYSQDKYPLTFLADGVYNTSPENQIYNYPAVGSHNNPNTNGTGAVVVEGDKTIWRADGGTENNPHPTALVANISGSFSPTSTAPVSAEVYGGLTLQAPLQSRPFDSIGFKVHWTQLTSYEQSFLVATNPGYNKSPNSVGFELNASIQLDTFITLQPTIQYWANANNYYNPGYTYGIAKDGFFFGGMLYVGIGSILGL